MYRDKETGELICYECYHDKYGEPKPEPTNYFKEYKRKHPDKFKEYYRNYYRRKRNIIPDRYKV